LEEYDFTLIRWTGAGIDPRFDYYFPEKERFLPALLALGIRVKVINTRKWINERTPFKEIIKQIKTKKILLTLSEWVASKDLQNLIQFVEDEKKELYILIQAEENKKVLDALREVLPHSKKVFVTLENYKKKFKRKFRKNLEKRRC